MGRKSLWLAAPRLNPLVYTLSCHLLPLPSSLTPLRFLFLFFVFLLVSSLSAHKLCVFCSWPICLYPSTFSMCRALCVDFSLVQTCSAVDIVFLSFYLLLVLESFTINYWGYHSVPHLPLPTRAHARSFFLCLSIYGHSALFRIRVRGDAYLPSFSSDFWNVLPQVVYVCDVVWFIIKNVYKLNIKVST